MEYISAQEAAERWGITKRRVQVLCSTNRIEDAVRIGNMWVIPESAEKPSDSRFKYKSEQKKSLSRNPIRLARNRIKAITTQAMHWLLDKGFSSEDAKIALITKFGVELLTYYCSDDTHKDILRNDAQEVISQITHSEINALDVLAATNEDMKEFIREYPFCCDDALSWCYQYANKMVDDGNYCSTQFFTEKYMITSLVDRINIKNKSKILDPSCGGANFLIYCLDVLTEDLAAANEPDIIKQSIAKSLDKLYGYEIDNILAMVASINLRLKCISILSLLGCSIDLNDFSYFIPNIFSPAVSTISGTLAIKKEQQNVIKIGKYSIAEISEVFNNVEIIVTNGRGVKGQTRKSADFTRVSGLRSLFLLPAAA